MLDGNSEESWALGVQMSADECVYWGRWCGERKRRELRMEGGRPHSEKIQSSEEGARRFEGREGSAEATRIDERKRAMRSVLETSGFQRKSFLIFLLLAHLLIWVIMPSRKVLLFLWSFLTLPFTCSPFLRLPVVLGDHKYIRLLYTSLHFAGLVASQASSAGWKPLDGSASHLTGLCQHPPSWELGPARSP